MGGVLRITNISVLILAACFGWNRVALAGGRPDGPHRATGAEQHVVTVENLRVHYLESGTGRTVVLIHGNAGDAEDFEFGAIEILSRNYRVIAIDRPGHGGSDRPEGKE